jgi:hypothetical protein
MRATTNEGPDHPNLVQRMFGGCRCAARFILLGRFLRINDHRSNRNTFYR